MSAAPTLADLRARVASVKAAPIYQKAALAEQALADCVLYFAGVERRLCELEKEKRWQLNQVER